MGERLAITSDGILSIGQGLIGHNLKVAESWHMYHTIHEYKTGNDVGKSMPLKLDYTVLLFKS